MWLTANKTPAKVGDQSHLKGHWETMQSVRIASRQPQSANKSRLQNGQEELQSVPYWVCSVWAVCKHPPGCARATSHKLGCPNWWGLRYAWRIIQTQRNDIRLWSLEITVLMNSQQLSGSQRQLFPASCGVLLAGFLHQICKSYACSFFSSLYHNIP